MVASGSRTMILVLYSAVSLVSINPEGSHNHPARHPRAVAQSRISLLLALEVAPTGRATADRHGAARLDPADERRRNRGGQNPQSQRVKRSHIFATSGRLSEV